MKTYLTAFAILSNCSNRSCFGLFAALDVIFVRIVRCKRGGYSLAVSGSA